ncbi:hypothetical protein [Laceyella tengchongensis]
MKDLLLRPSFIVFLLFMMVGGINLSSSGDPSILSAFVRLLIIALIVSLVVELIMKLVKSKKKQSS